MLRIVENPEDGTRVPFVLTQAAESEHRRVHVMLHGLGTSKDEYLDFHRHLADRLEAAGHSSVRLDFRSHGDSEAPEAEFTVFNCVSDALSVVRWCRENLPTHDVSLFGTSFGASIAILLARLLGNSVRHMNLLAPVLDYDRLYIAPVEPARLERFRNLVQDVVVEGRPRAATDELSFHRRMVIELASVSLKSVIPLISATVRIMHGEADATVPILESERALPLFQQASLHAFPRMEHGFTRTGDEDGTHPETLANMGRIADIILGTST